ncbi:hypothetical protein Lal_00005941 [Lupinus albus]|nr:hypothetical protein Lal_00005941 [Lupinus albus]
MKSSMKKMSGVWPRRGTIQPKKQGYLRTLLSCGFSIRRGHTYKHSKNNVDDIYKREYICHRAGISKQQKVVELERQRRRKSSRCKCSAKLIITKRTIGFEERWVITYFSNSHNHTLLDNKEVHFLPAYRDIPINDQGRILLLSKVGCSISIIMRVLELEKGIEAGLLPFLEKDIRNFLQSHSNAGKDNDASETNVLRTGQTFCFLPLPIRTGLSVKVNGFFEVSSNVCGIWYGDDIDKSGKVRSNWNTLFLEDVVAHVFMHMLLGVKRRQQCWDWIAEHRQ